MWYYHLNNIQNGPCGKDEIKNLLESGIISGNTLVWGNGMTQWTRLADTELKYIFKTEVPLPKPKANTSRWLINVFFGLSILVFLEKIADIFLANYQSESAAFFGFIIAVEGLLINYVFGFFVAVILLCCALYMKIVKVSKGGFIFATILSVLAIYPGGSCFAGVPTLIIAVTGIITTKDQSMRTIGKIIGYILRIGSAILMFIFWFIAMSNWLGFLGAILSFILILGIFIFPIVFWVVEGVFPTFYFIVWGIGIIGVIIAGFSAKDEYL